MPIDSKLLVEILRPLFGPTSRAQVRDKVVECMVGRFCEPDTYDDLPYGIECCRVLARHPDCDAEQCAMLAKWTGAASELLTKIGNGG